MMKQTTAAAALVVSACAWSAEPCAVLASVNIENHELLPSGEAENLRQHITGHCLTSLQMAEAVMVLEAAIHETGFVTGRVEVPPQNVSDGTLKLHYKPGMLSGYRDEQSGERRSALNQIFPQRADGQLNIRDTELGMTHLNRLPDLGASTSVVPDPDNPDSSLIVISQQKKRALSGRLSIDNHGSPHTGSWRVTNRLNIQNPLQRYDQLFLHAERDMDRRDSEGMRMLYGQYRVPYQQWAFTLSGSYGKTKYPLTAGGRAALVNRNKMADFTTERKLWLTPAHDLTLSGGLSVITRDNTIGGQFIDVHQRRSVYWQTQLAHRWQQPGLTVQSQVGYKQSTNAFGAKSTSQYGIKPTRQLTLETSVVAPFRMMENVFYYEGMVRGVLNKHQSDEMDHATLGDRYSVRGYPFSYSINAVRALISRNELTWQQALPYHDVYVAADVALPHFSAGFDGPRWLAGGEIGVKGRYKALDYQLFTGMPFKGVADIAPVSPYMGLSVTLHY